MNDYGPRISVIVPVYNVSRYLKQFFRSIHEQNYRNYEVIVWDDGSTDDSLKICEEYGKVDYRIKVYRSRNTGASMARKKAIEKSTGDFLVFADPDDWLDPNYLTILSKSVAESNADIAMCSECYVEPVNGSVSVNNESDDVIREEYLSARDVAEAILMRHDANLLHPIRTELWGKIFKADLFSGIDYPSISSCEDVIVLAEVICKSRHVQIISNKLYHYRVGREGSLETQVDLETLRNIETSNNSVCNIFENEYKFPSDLIVFSKINTILYILDKIVKIEIINNVSMEREYREYVNKLKNELNKKAYIPNKKKFIAYIYLCSHWIAKCMVKIRTIC